MATRRAVVATALGLVSLLGAFGLGWQLALATQNKTDQPPQARGITPAVPMYASPSAAEPDLTTSSWVVSPFPDQTGQTDFAVLESLEAQVHDSQAQTRRLEGQVTTLTGQVAALTETVSRLERETVKKRGSTGQQADEASFIAAGFNPTTAAKLVKQLGQFALDKMYLRDQATREGWIGTSKYREEQAALQQQNEAFRAELSEDEYDRFLYTTGRPNRIRVESVMGESQAEWAGLQPGDHIVRYAGEPMHGWSDLRRASSDGEAGALVPIQVEREGRIVQLSIERGPLGVRLGTESVKP
jgi:hypothetical protein